MNRLAALFGRPSPLDPRADGALLAAFLADRDEPAFAELVRRHGPLVWGVCRRLLPDPADAEDAFQAAFLVLVRRAHRLTRSPTVGPWLYRVGAWTARNLRRKNARRLAHAGELPDTVPDPRPTPEPALDLDAVLLGLSERHRAAVVLCCLQGLTHREAAERLGCAEGTVSSLVSRGLAKLRARFAGRDPATVFAAVVVTSAPPTLTAATVRSAAAVHLASLSAAASPAVATLAEGVLRMFWVKKATAGLIAAVALVSAGAGVGVSVRQVPRAVADEPAVAPQHKASDLDALQGLWQVTAVTTDGKSMPLSRDKPFQIRIRAHKLWFVSDIVNDEHTIELDPAAAPKSIDLTANVGHLKGKKWSVGIYEVQGDSLKLCMDFKLQRFRRPTTFESKPGDEFSLMTFQRAKPADPKPMDASADKSLREIRELRELTERMHAIDIALSELQTRAARLTEERDGLAKSIAERKGANVPRDPQGRLVIEVNGPRLPRERFRVSEYRVDNTDTPDWVTTIPQLLSPKSARNALRDLLTRTRQDKTSPKTVTVRGTADALPADVDAAVQAAKDAGFDSIQPAAIKPPKPAPEPAPGLGLSGALTATDENGYAFRLPKGMSGKLLLPNPVVRVEIETAGVVQNGIDSDNPQAVTFSGLKPGSTMAQIHTRRETIQVQVTVTDE